MDLKMTWNKLIISMMVILLLALAVSSQIVPIDTAPIEDVIDLPFIVAPDKLQFDIGKEQTNISYYGLDTEGNKVETFFDFVTIGKGTFGFEFDKETAPSKLVYQIDTSEDYSNEGYKLVRPTGKTRLVTNQIGQQEEKEINRYIDFSPIFGKKENLYEEVVEERERTVCIDSIGSTEEDYVCLQTGIEKYNVIVLKPRSYSVDFIKQGKSWVIEFFNLFDLDPSFVDDTASQWAAGSFQNMNTTGTGNSANLTSSGNNVSGSYGSQVFDSGNTNANWTNVTWNVEFPYGEELKSGSNITSDVGDLFSGGLNLSGLEAYWTFNNNTEAFGENRTYFADLAGNHSGTCKVVDSCLDINKTDFKVGSGSVSNGLRTGRLINVTYQDDINTSNVRTISVWFKRTDLGVVGERLRRILSFIDNKGLNHYWLGVSASTDAGTPASAFLFGKSFHEGGVLHLDRRATAIGTLGDTDAEWHHVVVLSNRTNITAFYLDGVSLVMELGTAMQNGGIPGGLTIGNRPSDSSRSLVGNIDELSLWNRTLRPDEIMNLYQRGANRLNLSARICSDSACASVIQARNVTFNSTFGRKGDLNFSQRGRYFQYNFTYSRNDTLGAFQGIHINNISIEFENATGESDPCTCPYTTLNCGECNLAACNNAGNPIYITGTGTQTCNGLISSVPSVKINSPCRFTPTNGCKFSKT